MPFPHCLHTNIMKAVNFNYEMQINKINKQLDAYTGKFPPKLFSYVCLLRVIYEHFVITLFPPCGHKITKY